MSERRDSLETTADPTLAEDMEMGALLREVLARPDREVCIDHYAGPSGGPWWAEGEGIRVDGATPAEALRTLAEKLQP